MTTPGPRLFDLPTPALLVDLDALESNLRKMADFYRAKKPRLRPHGKTHKCPPLARRSSGVPGPLELRAPSREIKLGDKLLLIAPHCDPTVNLYDRFHAFRAERVEEIWPVAARGRSQ